MNFVKTIIAFWLLLPCLMQAAPTFVGSGTEASPYQISTVADLQKLEKAITINGLDYKGKFFRQTADIDCSADTTFHGLATKGSDLLSFAGTYDGAGHSIAHLHISGSRSNAGFIGFVAKTGVIKNVTLLASCSIAGTDYVGGIVGRNEGTVSGCINRGTVSAMTYAAGIAGFSSGTVTGCYNEGTISANSNNASGIVGSGHEGHVANCQNNGTVTAQNTAGGIVATTASGCSIEACVNAALVQAYNKAGGIVGHCGSATVLLHNVCTGRATATRPTGALQGGISGSLPDVTVQASANLYDAVVNYAGAAGSAPFPGMAPLTSGYLPHAIFDTTAGLLPVLREFKDEPAVQAMRQFVIHMTGDATINEFYSAPAILHHTDAVVWKLTRGQAFSLADSVLTPVAPGTDTLTAQCGQWSTSWPLRCVQIPLSGQGTNDDPYLIASPADVLTLASLCNSQGITFAGKTLRVDTDLDFSAVTYEPIATKSTQFCGTLQGGGHKWTNVTLTLTKSSAPVGLFGAIGAQGRVSGIVLQSGSISAPKEVAGIAGNVYGSVDSCENRATVSGTANAGRNIAGIAVTVKPGGSISRCTSRATISGHYGYLAGIVAKVEGGAVVYRCTNHSSLSGSFDHYGGIACENEGTIDSCTNAAQLIKADQIAGGITSFNDEGALVRNCINLGTVKAVISAGGIAGLAKADTVRTCQNRGSVAGSMHIAGITAYCQGSNVVTQCTNQSTVEAQSRDCGGVVGFALGKASTPITIKDCANIGEVTCYGSETGGIVGAVTGSTSLLSACRNYGTVSAIGNITGGIAGGSEAAVTDCYNQGTIDAGGVMAGGIVGYGFGPMARCLNVGSVTSTGTPADSASAAAGICAYGPASITASVNLGTIVAGHKAAGLAGGYWATGCRLHGCYNAGTIAGSADDCGNLAAMALGPTSVTNCYYDSSVNPALHASADSLAQPLSTPALTLVRPDTIFSLAAGMLPMLPAFASEAVAMWHAATVVPAQADSLSSIAHDFTIGTPNGTIWTADTAHLLMQGASVRPIKLGKTWITKTCGSLSRTYSLTIIQVSGITEASSTASVASSTFYDLSGRYVGTGRPQQPGIYICRKAMTDGTSRSSKIIVKK